MKPIRLVALDLDGTLLDEEKNIDKQTVAVIRAVRERGVEVTLVTGRPLVSTLPYAKQLNLEVPLITYNGAVTSFYPQGRIIEKVPMPIAEAREMLAELEDAGFYIKVYIEDKLYVEEITRATIEFSNKFSIPFTAVGQHQLRNLEVNPLKIVVIERSQRIKEVWSLLEPWKEHFMINRDGEYGIEITNKTVDKGTSLVKLCNLLNIPLSQVMAVGNEGNDLTMIRAAGFGVAMENAYDELKKAAVLVTKTNDNLGVAYVLKKYILQEDTEVSRS